MLFQRRLPTGSFLSASIKQMFRQGKVKICLFVSRFNAVFRDFVLLLGKGEEKQMTDLHSNKNDLQNCNRELPGCFCLKN